MREKIETWGPIETVGDLIKQVNDIGDVDPNTPIEIFCHRTAILVLWGNKETGECHMEIDADRGRK